MNNVFFISGIDTDCGKTYVTGKLAGLLNQKGIDIMTHKMIQTGCEGISEDILEHRKMMQIEVTEADKNGESCPYVFSFPASPHYAAQRENKEIDIDKIYHSVYDMSDKHELVLCEGAGGLMVPITKDFLTINFIEENNLPLILVASSKLGSINHTLLSLQACANYGLDLKMVIYNELPGSNPEIAEDSFILLKEMTKKMFGNLVKFNRIDQLSEEDLSLFSNIKDNID